MSHSITIFYPSKEASAIHLDYNIEMTGMLQTINCSVVNDGGPKPLWLQVKKFVISSLKQRNVYTPVFDHANNNTNIDTTLFIDLAYREIMGAQKLVIGEE